MARRRMGLRSSRGSTFQPLGQAPRAYTGSCRLSGSEPSGLGAGPFRGDANGLVQAGALKLAEGIFCAVGDGGFLQPTLEGGQIGAGIDPGAVFRAELDASAGQDAAQGISCSL